MKSNTISFDAAVLAQSDEPIRHALNARQMLLEEMSRQLPSDDGKAFDLIDDAEAFLVNERQLAQLIKSSNRLVGLQ
jgi:hypothetical protein